VLETVDRVCIPAGLLNDMVVERRLRLASDWLAHRNNSRLWLASDWLAQRNNSSLWLASDWKVNDSERFG